MSERKTESPQPAENARFTQEHEWVVVGPDGIGTIGISAFAQETLGEVVFVTLSELGARLTQMGVMGEVESSKAVVELYAPVSGEVVEVNTALLDRPEHINEDPYGQGWLARVRISNPDELNVLMDHAAYQEMLHPPQPDRTHPTPLPDHTHPLVNLDNVLR